MSFKKTFLRDYRALSESAKHELIAGLNATQIETLNAYWPLWARQDQLAPEGDWQTWFVLGGRGAGKTRTGAEWVRGMALGHTHAASKSVAPIALIGETLQAARDVMVEGVSGLLAVHPAAERPHWMPSRNRLEWANGAVAQLYSAQEPKSLRGPQFAAAWCDELAKWPNADEVFDMLQFGLRLGDHPRQLVTTTPRPTALIKRLLKAPYTEVTRVKTVENEQNLAPGFLSQIVARYKGTALGRQELDGELIEDNPKALWQRAQLDRLIVKTLPELKRIVIAIDPPVTAHQGSDACGIVAAALGADERAYILQDHTIEMAKPNEWAEAVVGLYHTLEADLIVAETNQGGDMVATILNQFDPRVPVKNVRAKRAKWIRAEPVAALYAQGRVRHGARFAQLEDELCQFTPKGRAMGHSPDRVDAMVWAITELMLDNQHFPHIRKL